MAKTPDTVTFDSEMLDTFTSNLEMVLAYHDEGRLPASEFVETVRDLVNLVKRIPRTVKITIGENENG